jgi:magnesium-transporting ATPase (P-type)
MSLIVEYHAEYYIMTKGADSIMLPRCKFSQKLNNKLLQNTKKHLYEFAVEGLRTLVMAKRQLTEEEF